jgi:hypothetical protein
MPAESIVFAAAPNRQLPIGHWQSSFALTSLEASWGFGGQVDN